MDESGGLEGVARCFVRHLLGGHASEFPVDERQEFVRRLGAALSDGGEDSRHFTQGSRLRELGSAATEISPSSEGRHRPPRRVREEPPADTAVELAFALAGQLPGDGFQFPA